MSLQRILIGLAAALMLCAGVVLMFANEGGNNSLSGVFMKVGLMLAAVWLAYPKLIHRESQNAISTVLILLATLVLFAARPRVAVGALAVLVIAIGVNWAWKRISSQK